MTKHNHKKCIEKYTQLAQDTASQKGKKLTQQRLQVLQILLSDHKALGAYDILDKMRNLKNDKQSTPQPPTVYRALDFLLDLGLIHKIESQNSYYACMVETTENEPHLAQAFICDDCGHVEEKIANSGAKNLLEKADTFGFQVEQVIMECRGKCAPCVQKQDGANAKLEAL